MAEPPPKPEGLSEFNYQGEPLYHGGSRDVGDAILPNAVHGKGRANSATRGGQARDHKLDYDEYLRTNKAFSTADENYAWYRFAHQTANLGGGRGRVYEVEPQKDMDVGAFTNEYVADKFPVRQRLDIKPGHQGTFPIDWRPYLHRNLHVDNPDQFANHPSPHDQANPRYTNATRAEMEAHAEPEKEWDHDPHHPDQMALFDLPASPPPVKQGPEFLPPAKEKPKRWAMISSRQFLGRS